MSLSVSLEQRSFYDVKNLYSDSVPNAELIGNLFNDQTALVYRFPSSNRQEVYIPYGERTYHIITDRMDILDVKNMLKSFALLPSTVER